MSEEVVHELSESQRKRIRLGVFAFYFSQGLCFSSWASRIPDIKSYLGLDDAAWGTILLMIPIGQICGMTISGLMVSKIGSKKILPVSLVFYVLALLAIGASRTEYALLMSLIFFGFCGNFCNISVNTQGVNIEAMYGKAIMSSFHGGWSLACFAGSAIGLLMINIHLNPFYHFLIVAVIVLANLVVSKKYLQPDIKKKKDPQEAEAKKRNKPETFLYLLGIVAFCGMAAEGAMSDWGGLYLKDIVKVSDSLVPLGFAAYMVTMASGRFFADGIIERWGRQRIIQAGGILISIGLFLAVAFPYLPVTLVAFMIIGLGTSSIVPTIYSIAGQRTKIPTGIALTIVSSISFLGFLMGPPLIGYISQATNLRYSYGLIGVFGICIVILSSVIKIFKTEK